MTYMKHKIDIKNNKKSCPMKKTMRKALEHVIAAIKHRVYSKENAFKRESCVNPF